MLGPYETSENPLLLTETCMAYQYCRNDEPVLIYDSSVSILE